MTPEEKDLLLKDLAARVPYKVMVEQTLFPSTIADKEQTLKSVQANDCVQLYWYKYIDEFVPIHCVKPYLRPMSSMTKEEKEELLNLLFDKESNYFYIDEEGFIDGKTSDLMRDGLNYPAFGPINVVLYTDWLNAHHFDYRDLIKKGLALEASEDILKYYKCRYQWGDKHNEKSSW